MDPVLKAGLPKLFVLASLQTTATHTVTECREGKKYGTFYGKKVQIRRTNCQRIGGKYYRAKCKGEKANTIE